MTTVNTKAPKKDETPLQKVSMDWAKEKIVENLFRRYRGARPDMEERLQAAHVKRYGIPMRKVTEDNVRAMYLESPPGHGKTTTHRVACKEFADMLGMNFVENPSLQQMQRGKIDKDCFVFSTVNLGGATSKHEIGGLMAKLKIGDQEFMGHLPDWRIAATMMAGYGYVLFDDFVTSSHQVHNACLDMLLNGSAGDMKFDLKDMANSKLSMENGQLVIELDQQKADAGEKLNESQSIRGSSPVHIGLAGNRGSSDGNKTYELTTATVTRIARVDVTDTTDNWQTRATRRNNDDIGDGYYSVFMRQFPELFSVVGLPSNGMLTQQPNPRTHDACMDEICNLLHLKGGMTKIAGDSALQARVCDEIQTIAGSHIGVEIKLQQKGSDNGAQYIFPATAVAGFYNEMFLGAGPRAEDVIRRGIVDEEFIKGKYNHGNCMDGQNFGYQFAAALAQVAATRFGEIVNELKVKNPKEEMSNPESQLSMALREPLKNLSMGLNFLQKSLVTFSLDKFNMRAAVVTPQLFEGEGSFKSFPRESMRTIMYGLIKDNTKYNSADLGTTFAHAITNYSNFKVDGALNDTSIMDELETRRAATRKAAMAALTS